MKKRVLGKCLRITAFLTLLIVILGGISAIVSPKDNRNMHNTTANGFLGEKKNTIDVLILGDSESFTSFSPMQIWRDYGYTTYVCGTSRQYVQDTYNFLERFTQSQKPKVVFLETNLLYRAEGRFSDVFRVTQNTAFKFLPVFEYHDRWKMLKLTDLHDAKRYTWRDELKGFRINGKITPYEGTPEYMKYTDKAKRLPRVCTFYFKKMVELCKENDAQLVLISTASPVNWSYEKHNGVAQLAASYGLTYVDMNLVGRDKLKIDWEKDTYDKGDHLNFYGAQKATAFLGNYIKENFSIPDNRGDKAFKHWDDDLKVYEKNVSKL